MTAIPTIQGPFLSWFNRRTPRSETPANWTEDDLRREYVTRIVATEGVTGEYGVQALMGLFPKDF